MNKRQYRAIVVAQKKQGNRDPKLIHLLINFRSWYPTRYPQGFVSEIVAVNIGISTFEWAMDAFICMEGFSHMQPRFRKAFEMRWNSNINRELETALPF